MSFLSTNRSNPCPCCGNISGKCRQKLTSFSLPDNSSIEGWQIFCIISREDTNIHKFTGETSDRLWGKFISFELSTTLSHAWGNRNSHNSSFTKPTIIHCSPKPKKQTFSHLLSLGDRHISIKQVLAQLSLTPAHRQGLIQRGFNDDQIKQYGFKSVNYLQTLTAPVSDRLAGVAPGGKSLTNKFSGLIVPIQHHDGSFIGWQYRLDRASNCRYLLASSEDLSSHLAEYSELPLSFCFPDGGVQNSDYIALTEGVGFKPQLTANFHGLLSLGASGGLFASSPTLFRSYLKQASQLLATKSVLLFPDAGAVRNPLVLKQYQRTINLVQNLGFNVRLAWWSQINKSCSDPDEYQGNYRIISPNIFFTIGLRYSAFFPAVDGRNLVRQFFDLLSTAESDQLLQVISVFKFQYQPQFQLFKDICWQHLDPQRKQLIHSLISSSL
jgi:hypothetical protein